MATSGIGSGHGQTQASEQAAQATGIKLQSRGIAHIAELDDALTAMEQNGLTLIVQLSPFTFGQCERIIASAMKNGLRTIFAHTVAAREGSPIEYGPQYLHDFRRAPFYVDCILKDTKPADLLAQPTKIDLLVNLKTAKPVGMEVPLSLLICADELLE